MNNQDFAANIALECASRAGRILPVLDERCDTEGFPLSPGQKIALGSLLIQLFDGLTESIENMVAAFDVLRRFAESPFDSPLTDEALAEWLRDDKGPLQ